jgi:hypothetical protein
MARTTKFTGVIGLLMFLFLVFLFIDSGIGVITGAKAASLPNQPLATGENPLFVIGLAVNAVLAAAAFGSLFLFWTKRVFAKRLIMALFLCLIAFRIFELVLAFTPGVTKAASAPVSILDTVLVKGLIGVVLPVIFLVYLFAPERDSDRLPRSGG